MKKLFLLLCLLAALCAPARAQLATGSIFTYGTTCTTSNCVTTNVPYQISMLSVNVQGSFAGSIQVQQSTDNGATWLTISTITTQTTVNFTVSQPQGQPAVTNFRLISFAWSSGRANITINSVGQTTPVAGTVNISNFPSSTAVNNFPSSQNVNGSVTATTQQGIIYDIMTGPLDLTTMDTGSTVTPVANGANFITGTPTPGSIAMFSLASGYTTMRFQVTGTWTGTVQVEMSVDGGSTWTIQGLHQSGTAGEFADWTANFVAHGVGVGFTNVRMRATVSWTGTAHVLLRQSINPASIYVQNAIHVKDQTNPSVQAMIKPANTPATSTDNALVVAISPNNPITVGTVTVGNFPAVQTVSVNNLPATQPVSGSVTVSNFPTSVNVGNFPSTQTVAVSNWPATQPISGSVSVSNFPATQPVSGSVSVSNFPATQPVSGSVSVSNFPATQAVTGTFWPATQPVSGTVAVSNFPATQPISGTVAVSNFPAVQPASQSGSWSVTAVQPTGTNLHVVVDGNNPCQNPSSTLSQFNVTVAATTLTQFIAASGSTKIHICSLFLVNPSGAPTLQFQTGTGTNCATGNATLTPSWKLSSTSVWALPAPVAVTPAGVAACYIASATGVQLLGTYVQQ